MSWRPLSRRSDPAATEFDALHEGVPTWLRASLTAWVSTLLVRPVAGKYIPDPARLHMVERQLHLVDLNWSSQSAALATLLARCRNDDDVFLDLVDLLARQIPELLPSPNHMQRLTELARILEEGGSAWRLASLPSGDFGLERRVDETVAKAAHQVMDQLGRAGEHLSAAWAQAYGRHPSPGEAYRQAVKAVEAAAIPVVCPLDITATLGKILGEMHSNTQRWAVNLHPPEPADPANALVAMLRLLWKSQLDRHGTPDQATPFTVSDAEAQTALHLAITLVQWFSSGAVMRTA